MSGTTLAPAELLALLCAHEQAMRDLYEAFAQAYPLHAAVWNGIAREEQVHAGWIQQILHLVESGAVVLSKPAITAQAINITRRSMERTAAKARAGQLSEREACTYAVDIEHAMIEDRYFAFLHTGPGPHAHLVQALERETSIHKAKIEAHLSDLK